MADLLIRQTFSQRTWPEAGDVDDCWVLSAIQAANAVAPWLPLLTVTEFRALAGDPDDGHDDGGNVDDLMRGIRAAWPALAPLCTPLRGSWTWDRVLEEIKAGRPASVCVVSARLPDRYGFAGLHQVTYFHEPGVGLRVANPLAPDRSTPTRIATRAAQTAAEAYGGGRVHCVLFPTVEDAYPTHPLYQAPGGLTEAECAARVELNVAAAIAPYETRIKAIKIEEAEHSATIADL